MGKAGRGAAASLGLSKADLLVAHIKHGVVLADENISQDPHPIQPGRQVDPHEPTEAFSLPQRRYLKKE